MIATTPKPSPECGDCRGTGIRIHEHGDGTTSASHCHCLKRTRRGLIRHFNNVQGRNLSGLDIATERPAHPDQTHVVDRLRRFAEGFGHTHSFKGLYLHSHSPGSGKTRLGAAVANAIAKAEGLDSQFMTMPQMIELYKTAIAEDKPQASITNPLTTVAILVLDELGSERSTEYAEELLYAVIDRRYHLHDSTPNTLTVVTSNLTLGELKNRYHPRIASRLSELCIQIPFPNIDLRTLKRLAGTLVPKHES